MAYKEAVTDTAKDAWGRQLHLLNLLTTGQLIATQGEMMQNPYYVSQGCDMMLEVIGPMIEEDAPVLDAEGKPVKDAEGKIKMHRVKGIDSPTYKKYVGAIAEARLLINYAMNTRIKNRNELLNRAYSISRALKAELLQRASDYQLDFKSKLDPYEAYKR